MIIGIPKETAEHERRVAAVPETVKKLLQAGFEVRVQSGAGLNSAVVDAEYQAAGATVSSDARAVWSSDIVLKVQKPSAEEVPLLKENSFLVALLQPLVYPDLMRTLAQKRVNALAMDMVPRIARAQKLDALSSQSNVSGYKAVLMAANTYGKMMPMLMTAAGTVSPARVFVVGAGVAGLQAIATAKRLGAIVEAFDTRPVVKEQVESLGAKFVQPERAAADAEDKRGYAKEMSRDEESLIKELIAKRCAASDIVITTALIPGKKAPLLITEAAVRGMRQGSVIVDLAADGGGNCELTDPGKESVKYGVTVIGTLNVPSTMAAQSSQLYARNVLNLILEISKDKTLVFDEKNEIVRDALITRDGRIVSAVLAAATQKGAV